MNQEIKAQWLADLRSGKFKQGVGFLTNFKGGRELNCCLGVLCKRAVEAGIVVATKQASGITVYHKPGEDTVYGSTGVLPWAVAEWAGLDDSAPVLPNGRVLTEMNDEFGFSFSRIADEIESGL